MPPDRDDESVFDEPQNQPRPPSPDPSEYEADRVLDEEQHRGNQSYRDGQSIYDEPAIFPGRAEETIGADWSCDKCGYNLRGLPTGHPCPECGHIELYRPPPPGASSYADWLRERMAKTSPGKAWLVTILLALCGGPWAVVAAFSGMPQGSAAGAAMILIIVFSPVIEETMKIAAAAWVVEVRPYLFKSVEQIQIATVGAALCFSAIENVIYLNIYVPNPTPVLALWRWTVCVALHVGCTLIATGGLVTVWQQAMTDLRKPRLGKGLRALVIAIVVHAGYNASAFGMEFLGWW